MEKYAVPVAPIGENPKPIARSHWKRSLIQLTGKSDRHYLHDVAPRLMQSYSEIGAFPHAYYNQELPCVTHLRGHHPFSLGIYLASVTRVGCLTVHEFESLYCQSNGSGAEEDQGKHLLHIQLHSANAVRWNPANQNEVACTSLRNNEVLIFDIGYASSEPTAVLRKRPAVSVHDSSARLGLSDIALSNDDARSCVIGASKSGFIYIWDLRGGRSSAAFQSHKEAQSSILPKEIQSININPSCPYQLGFHLDDGW
ncbi:putative transcription factor WD40-like family [Helianthus annuus]|nr:putative transcription factor WD40-like family [Helianthus annuus]